MSVVDDDIEILTEVEAVHTTFDGGEGGDAIRDGLVGETDFFANGKGGERIINIELPGDLGLYFNIIT